MEGFVRALFLGVAIAALGAVASANAATMSFGLASFNATPVTEPSTEAFTFSPGLNVTASGYSSSNTLTALSQKNEGGDEIGLGLANDSTGDGEIEYGKGYVQLDVSQLIGHVTGVTFSFGSTSAGEVWAVYGSNTSGQCGSGYAPGGCGTALQSSSSDGTTTAALLNFGAYNYYDFVEISHIANSGCVESDTCTDNNDNILLSSMSGTLSTVPEPITLSLFGVGLAGAVGLRRRRKAKA
jgi:hypothetical protein